MFLFRRFSQGYRWLKEKILNEEGRKQQNKLRELTNLSSSLNCTLAQLAIGSFVSSMKKRVKRVRFFSSAWCLRNENVHCVLLGATSTEQLYENLSSLQVC